MRHAGKAGRKFGQVSSLNDFSLGPPMDERTMLLELASELSRWEVRNEVFRQALDRTAHDLIDLARAPP